MSQSPQDKFLKPVRPPRVRITYEVETGGAPEEVEEAFVIGVMADLSGHPKEPLKPLKQRKFIEIDSENFNWFLAKTTPRLSLQVPNRLTNGKTELHVELIFTSMEDFAPTQVAEQVPSLKELLRRRHHLSSLFARMGPSAAELEILLSEVVANPALAAGLALEVDLPAKEMEQIDAKEARQHLRKLIRAASRWDRKEENRVPQSIKEFIRAVNVPNALVSKDVEHNANSWIQGIDKRLTIQLNEILHHPDFQRLEATWRGLHYLVHNAKTGELLKIRVVNVTKNELAIDLKSAVDTDQSWLFYEMELSHRYMYGCWQPFGLLVGDYEFDHSASDVEVLQGMAALAAAAHAPFVAAVSPRMFGMSSFADLRQWYDRDNLFQGVDFRQWNGFRKSDDARYVALTIPRVSGRHPYGEKHNPVEEFWFEEAVNSKHDNNLWMSAAWAYAVVIARAFVQHRWFARIRGPEGGGKVEGLPGHTFMNNNDNRAEKRVTEVALHERHDIMLSRLGFLPLLQCKDTDHAAFFSAQSCHSPKTYSDPDANINAELSVKLSYIMCSLRFVHYLKVLTESKIVSYVEVDDCENWLNGWINQYLLPDSDHATIEQKSLKPLREAKVQLRQMSEKPGWLEGIVSLRPHYQLEELQTSLRFTGRMPEM